MEEDIIKLRRLTGLGVSECRRAYEKLGNVEEAYTYLRDKWGDIWTTADK